MKNILSTIQPHIVEGARLMLSVYLFAAVGLYLIYAIMSVGFPYPLDYGEAPLVDQARRLAAGENIYQSDISTPPYTISNYPPVFIAIMAPFVNISEAVFLIGRSISVLSALATAMFLGLTLYAVSGDQFASISTGMLFLAISYVVYWSTLARVDLLALALSTAAIWLVISQAESRWSVIGAGLLLVAAAYTRQSYGLAAPLSLFGWLWFQNRRRSLELLSVVVGLGLFLFVILTAITSGGFFFHIITANINSFSIARIGRQFSELIGLLPILLALATMFIIAGRGRVSYWRFPALYLIGGLLSALTVGKIGATVNYFLELSAALTIIAGIFIAANRQHSWRYAALLVLIALQTGWLMQYTLNRWVDDWLTPRRSKNMLLQSISYETTTVDGPILADEYMGLLTIQDSPLYLQPFEMTQLAKSGLWDQTGLLNQIEQQLFPQIIIYHRPFSTLHETRWTPEMLDMIKDNYQPELMMAGNVIYVPNTDRTKIAISEPVQAARRNATVHVGPIIRIGDATVAHQPDMAINPLLPNHLATILTQVNDSSCSGSRCPSELLLYTSMDGGQTWREQPPFTGGRGNSSDGQVAFDSAGNLYALGIRDESITINRAEASQSEYRMTLDNQLEVTSSQVDSKPQLNINPDTDALFLAFDSQYEDRLISAPSIARLSQDQTLPRATPMDQYVGLDDFLRGQTNLPSDINALLGSDSNVSMIWTWSPQPWLWPRDVWLARSIDNGNSFSQPARIDETWGPIAVTARNNNYYLLYRAGTESEPILALAISTDHGQTWTSTDVNGTIPLSFNVDMAPSVDVATNGMIDIAFYAPAESCAVTMKAWQDTLDDRLVGTCNFDIYYTYSQDGGQSFNEPLRLNDTPIGGEALIRLDEPAADGLRVVVASGDEVANIAWIGTDDSTGMAAYFIRIER